jgi:3-deoxy-D-manno-octulosonic-acid transferase
LRTVYDIILFFTALIYSPIHLVRLCFSPKYRKSTLARLGLQKIPVFQATDKVYWIHSVSVGETQVAGTVTAEILRREPHAKVVVSTITETGQAVAKKIPGVSATFYYPLDFSFIVGRMMAKLKPSAVFIIETDLWFNFLNTALLRKVPVFLLNGKISETTLKRYKQFPKLAKKLLAPFHHLFVQSETYAERFRVAGIPNEHLSIAGNVKLDSKVPQLSIIDQEELAQNYKLKLGAKIVVFGSTHAGEEELCVAAYKELSKKFNDLCFILVPRHPERFNGVADYLKREGVDFLRASKIEAIDSETSFLLVDQMGMLMKLYSLSTVCVVAGSFTPHVGGHNILEPSFYAKPFIYGPWIYKQPGFHQMNLDFRAGIQCKAEELSGEILKLLNSPQLCSEYGERGFKALEVSKGATAKIINEVFRELGNE